MARKKTYPKETIRARKVLDQSVLSSDGFYEAFVSVREYRKAARGASTDKEQDLLRAAVVFAAAGLDSVVKELIRGCIHRLAAIDSSVQREFEIFVSRQLRGDTEDPDSVGGRRFLAKILAAHAPQARLIELYILELTGSSLQSASQLTKAAKALGLEPKRVGIDVDELQETFDTRNKIIHELDVNLEKTAARRSRNSRTWNDMVEHSNKLLEIADSMIDGVETKLTATNAAD